MKTKMFVIAAVLALVAILGVSGYAFAQTSTPPNGYPGMMGGRGGMMDGNGGMMGGNGGMMAGYGSHGPMHEYMVQALAEKLGLSVEDLQARIDAGETMWGIAQAGGLSDAEIAILMQQAHDQALEAAVAAGAITQQQADWMDSHMDQMFSNGGTGGCHGGLNSRPTRTGANL